MPMLLISPTEPELLRRMGETSTAPETYGADILIPGYGGLTGLQRKTTDDLLASASDGRLERELPLLRRLPRRALILEGRWTWTADGMLAEARKPVTYRQVMGILASVTWVHEVPILPTADLHETAELVGALEKWAGKAKHPSLLRRPSVRKESAWGTATSRDFARHLLQSFPGVGITLADAIYDRFGRVPLAWTVSEKELLTVPGIGPHRARALHRSLES